MKPFAFHCMVPWMGPAQAYGSQVCIDSKVILMSLFLCRLWFRGPLPCCSSCSQTPITTYKWLLCIATARVLLSAMLERRVRTQKTAHHAAFCAALVLLYIHIYAKRFTFYILFGGTPVPRSAPRNLQVYDPTTSSLTVSWEPAVGPVTQYRITYAPTTGDPIEEYVSVLRNPHHFEKK